MIIIKAIFAISSLIGNYFKLKKAMKLIRETAAKIKKIYKKRKLKKEKLLAKGYPKLKKLKKLKKFPKLQRLPKASYKTKNK